jgi:hypothetical protein
MITFSPNIQSIMDSDDLIETFYMISFDSLWFICNYYYDVEFEGNTYVSDNRLKALEPPSISSTVDREQYKIELNSNAVDNEAYHTNNIVGKKITVYLVFIDPSTNRPLLSTEDVLIVYRGRVDGFSPKYTTDEFGESTVILTCASPMANLDVKGSMYLSDNEVRSRNPNDTCAERIYEGSRGLSLKWGKE